MLEVDARGAERRRTEVIAEIATNHGGDLDRARRLLVEAAAAGADLVSVPAYLDPATATERELLAPLTLSADAYRELGRLAIERRVGLISSPTTVRRAAFLIDELGLTAIKVQSSEMLNLELLDYLNGRVETVYLGTGLARLDEVRLAVSRLRETRDVVVMHSVDEYPLAASDAHLTAIATLAEALPAVRLGYLDHTIGLLAPLLAVALGATVVEKHFTLDRSLPGSDHVLSVTPVELAEMIHGVRQTETLLGDAPPAQRDHPRPAVVRRLAEA
ncbi:MAG: N-acetylneuraminate synthase family protein [Solirubrobacterales bacterium]|nr:N-acetylneuraminate synthase family protein [Solirubrobacterales bacterium]